MSDVSDITFSDLESLRLEYREKVGDRDGFSPDQQIAMAAIHNQQASGGSPMAMLVILSKTTLRTMFCKGVIDYRGSLTVHGNDLLRKWCKESRAKKGDKGRE